MDKIIAEVHFTAEVTSQKMEHLRVLVVKIASDTGVAVWAGGNPTEGGRKVVIRKDVGDGWYMLFSGVTVGHLSYRYGVFEYHTAFMEAYRSHYERSPDNRSDEEWKSDEEKLKAFGKKLTEELIHVPILNACRRLGVTKLQRHGGDFPCKVENLEIEVLVRKDDICIDL